jgi:hypothetical protein
LGGGADIDEEEIQLLIFLSTRSLVVRKRSMVGLKQKLEELGTYTQDELDDPVSLIEPLSSDSLAALNNLARYKPPPDPCASSSLVLIVPTDPSRLQTPSQPVEQAFSSVFSALAPAITSMFSLRRAANI